MWNPNPPIKLYHEFLIYELWFHDLQEVVGGLRCRGSLISRIWKSTKNNINFKINLCVNQSMLLMDQYIYIYWLSHNAFKNHIILFNLTKLADIKREKHYKIRFDIRRYDKCARLLEAASHKDKSIHRGSISCVSNSVDSLRISLSRIGPLNIWSMTEQTWCVTWYYWPSGCDLS